MSSICQPSIRHLILKRRLDNENEILILAHKFPNIKYLELLLPLDESSFIRCLNSLVSLDSSIEKKYLIWPELIHFSTKLVDIQHQFIWDGQYSDWFIRKTNLKYCPSYIYCFRLTLSFWF